MAVLGATTLTGCLYIESFLGGTDPGTGTGYKCVFNQTTPSTSWTKETALAYNDIALRVVTGTGAATGGSTAFSTVLTARSIGLSIQQAAAGVTFNQAAGNVSTGQAYGYPPASLGLQGAVADLPSHTHQFQRNLAEPILDSNIARTNATLTGPFTSGGSGSSLQHGHTATWGLHAHGVTDTHGHGIAGQHGHTPPGPGTQDNFAVLYRDVVIARKDVKP